MQERGQSRAPEVLVVLDEGRAWSLLRRLARAASEGVPGRDGEAFALDVRGELVRGDADRGGWLRLTRSSPHGWEPGAAVTPAARRLFDLYVTLCSGPDAARLRLAHLGQSLDGRVATDSGASRFITGAEDVRHTHCLRALFDAVVVGVQTALADDPALTTRQVPGTHPTRVVLDPRGRLSETAQVLRDGAAPTLIVESDAAARTPSKRPGVETLRLPAPEGRFDAAELVSALDARGMRRLFVEGGGITVSRLLEAGVLHRLQVAVAPTILGSGRPSFSLPPVDRLDDAVRVRVRRFQLGEDMLFDCELAP